jgi:hypothetical protein
VIAPLPGDPALRIRVIDEEGEDYLYLATQFIPLDLTPKSRQRVMAALG